MKNTDLHTHSNYSDGTLTPKELVKKAKLKRIKHIALTDHNCVQGIKEAINAGKKLKIAIIPGVEILSEWGEVLGYYIDIKNKELLKLLDKNQKELDAGARVCIAELQNLNINISYAEVKKEFPKYPLMCFFVAQLLVKKGIIKTPSELYKEYIGKKFKLQLNLPKMDGVIKIIKKAGGAAVLAHPFADSDYKKEFLNIKKLVKAGLDGIEVENGQYKLYNKKIKNKIIEISHKYNLILTSGSDFHGKTVKSELGECLCDEEVIIKLKKRTQKGI